jgi:hypothetical protein
MDISGEFQIIVDFMESNLLKFKEVEEKVDILFELYEEKILLWSTHYYEELAKRSVLKT